MSARGALAGRYLVLQRLGHGGMGEVVMAYDPELDRKVALKLLHPSRTDDPDRAQALTARLVREAQSLAKVSHQNVVTVHDVGAIGSQVFIAMELIEGKTLCAWSRVGQSWRAVVDVMVRAGRGLVAAHAAGLVHRDFKPGNVMLQLRTDGAVERVVVLDFGLALHRGESSDTATQSGPTPGFSEDREPRLTRTGARVGTPAYMSPEQHLGQPVTALADQFGFCASLYEALYCLRPFRGDASTVGEAIVRGDVRPFPRDVDVPLAVKRILMRGMSVEPADRYPTMAAMLDELGRTVSGGVSAGARFGRLGLLASLGGGAIAIAGMGAYVLQPAAAQSVPCEGAQSRLDAAWAPERAAAIATAFGEADPELGPTASERVTAVIDQYANAWVTGYRDACEATHVHHEQSDLLLDRRIACLDAGRRQLAGLVDVFEDADRAVVRQSVQAALALPRVEPCADVTALQTGTPMPTQTQAESVDAVRGKLGAGTALGDAGRTLEAVASLQTLVAEAAATGYRPVHTDARLALGHALVRASKADDAAVVLEDAYFDARRDEMHRVVTRAAIELAFVHGERRQDTDTALSWARHAEAELERWPDDRMRAELEGTRGVTLMIAGELGEARRTLQGARDKMAAATGEDSLPTVRIGMNLANAVMGLGDIEGAEALLRRTVEVQAAALGASHPDVARARSNLASVLLRAERFHEARAMFEQALHDQRRVLGPDHAGVAPTLHNLGLGEMLSGDLDAAQGHLADARRIREASLGPKHPHVAASHDALGSVALERGEHDLAIEHFVAARDIYGAALGAEHRAVSMALHHHGMALRQSGRAAAAIAPLQRAVDIRDATPGDPGELAEARFELARALWDRGRREDRDRALSLATEARNGFDLASAPKRYRDEVDDWIVPRAGR